VQEHHLSAQPKPGHLEKIGVNLGVNLEKIGVNLEKIGVNLGVNLGLF
jgi:hypothetical protein